MHLFGSRSVLHPAGCGLHWHDHIKPYEHDHELEHDHDAAQRVVVAVSPGHATTRCCGNILLDILPPG